MSARALTLALLLLPPCLAAADAGAPAPESASARDLGQVRQQISQSRRGLDETRKAMQLQQRALREDERREGSVLGQLEGLDKSLDLARRDLGTHQHNLQLVRQRLAEVRALLEADRASLAANQEALGQRLAGLYREGDLGWAMLLLDSRSPAELLSRLRFLRALARDNARLMDETRAEMERVAAYEQEYSAKESELARLEQKAMASQRQITSQRQRKQALLRDIRRKKQKASATLGELKQAAESLQGLMARLKGEAREAEARQAESERQARQARLASSGGTLLKNRGGNLWPVEGRLISRYGKQKHPQFGTWVFNRGVQIAAPEGTPFSAVAAGQVLYAGWFTGFGQMVVLDHGGGYYTLYAQASSLAVEKGQSVAAGAALGAVGDTGSLGESALYFEVRQNGKAIDPLQWLQSRAHRAAASKKSKTKPKKRSNP
jgi:septal ring factor EnvC (AmiA/AmiB activator)